jgi:heterodisulfide reductase subunit A
MWPVIDSANCLYLNKGICRICERLCPAKAINLGQRPQQIEVDVGAIIVATGYSQYDVSSKMPEYGCGESESVITGLEFERLSSASGPTSGELKLSGRVPKSVAIILCVGSRDVNHLEYCCRIGCIAGLKHAYYVVSHIPDARVYVCYTDIRAFGKGYEEFYEKIRGRENVFFIRGRPSEIFIRQDGSPYFDVYDSNTNQLLTISPDLVVLETGLVPDPTISELRRVLNFSLGSDGFALELHPKLRPTETSVDGIFLAGAVQGPKDIPDTVAQAGAAAASAITLMARGYVESVPYTAEVDESLCSGCGICELLCAYGAISITEKEGRKAVVDALKCKGCGSCAAGCPSGALEQRGFERQQILAMVDAVSLP